MGAEPSREWVMKPRRILDRDAVRMVGSIEVCEVRRSSIQIQGCCYPENSLFTVQAQSPGPLVTVSTIPTALPSDQGQIQDELQILS